jgi:nicotinamidase-related amidase
LNQAAVLLMDMQRDFLGADGARMPVDAAGAAAVLRSANAVLARHALAFALPVLVVNQFPPSARLANFFRKGAAVAGTPGAELDPRLCNLGQVKVFSKSSASAFTNPELESYLQAQGVRELYVMGVFAEGCVRATVLDARRRGYQVNVIAEAVATNAPWKKQFALWSMKRSGATLLPTIAAAHPV